MEIKAFSDQKFITLLQKLAQEFAKFLACATQNIICVSQKF